jgi:metal-sulfur cluster biosynthetic enzyme
LDKEELKAQILEALEEVNDPELGIDVVNLGLIYGIEIDDERNVTVLMTLTAMGCPLAGLIKNEAETVIQEIPEVNEVTVQIVWNPPWNKNRMSRYAKIALGIPD